MRARRCRAPVPDGVRRNREGSHPHARGVREAQAGDRVPSRTRSAARSRSGSESRVSSATSPRTQSTTTRRTSRRCSSTASPSSRSASAARVITKEVSKDSVSIGSREAAGCRREGDGRVPHRGLAEADRPRTSSRTSRPSGRRSSDGRRARRSRSRRRAARSSSRLWYSGRLARPRRARPAGAAEAASSVDRDEARRGSGAGGPDRAEIVATRSAPGGGGDGSRAG